MPSLRWTLIAGRAQILLLFVAGFCVQARAADICDPSVLPSEIQTKLEKNYPDWQPEKIENLYEDDRQFWIKAHLNDCPGIAIGHFESKTELSYALLLVSKPDRKRPGLRILVFSRPGPSAPYVVHLVSKWDTGTFYEGSDQVIATVPAGHYEEAVGPKKVQTDLDGIWYEVMEKGAILYYWKNGRYHELVTSD
jgi:hypothetical protein